MRHRMPIGSFALGVRTRMDAFSIIDLKKAVGTYERKTRTATKKEGQKRSDSFLYQSQQGDEGDEGKSDELSCTS
jgi:hypothetical protein